MDTLHVGERPFDHPLWLVGFRPLFTLAFISGALFPLLWALAFSGSLSLPANVSPLQWHAHEMLFGFGWAVLGGFLLTASKNWVHIRGLHGFPLAAVTALWIVERAAVLAEGSMRPLLRLLLLNAFTASVAGYVVWCLVRYREQDTFKDNYFFVLALPLFVAAKNLVLLPEHFALGSALAIGLFRLAFAVMFERTMTQFMKNTFSVQLLRNWYLDFSIKATVFLSAFEAFLPSNVAVVLLALAASLLLFRLFYWSPLVGFKRFEIGVMYVGYLGLVAHLALEALRLLGILGGVGTLAVHTFTFLCMGIVIPAMLIRICQGHTGRKLVFTFSDKAAIWSMGAAAVFRLVMPQVLPEHYLIWVAVSALGWTICFSLIGYRLVPFLWQPRVDGREH